MTAVSRQRGTSWPLARRERSALGSLGGHLIAAVSSVGAGLLAVAGAAKVMRPLTAMGALAQLRLPRSAPFVRTLGFVEAAIAIAWLLWPSNVTAAVLCAIYVTFVIVGLALFRGSGADASCGCLGRTDTRFTLTHLIYNIAVAGAAAAAALWRTPREFIPAEPFAAAGFAAALGVATYLSYLLLTEFDDAASAWRKADGAEPRRDISLVRVEPRR
jgi:methylamine utilization protein MauE